MDEQNAQTQQQQVFSLSRAEEDEGLVEEDEEEELEEDKMSLHSSYSGKHRNTRRGEQHGITTDNSWCNEGRPQQKGKD